MSCNAHRIGIDVGGSFIKAGLFDAQNQVLKKKKVRTVDRSFNRVCDQLAELVDQLMVESSLAVGHIGVGVPGGVCNDRATVHVSPNFPDWKNVNLAEALKKRNIADVIVENDANCAALAESKMGAGRGSDSSILFTLGTGVGGGIVIDGSLYRGHWGMAGELGHIPIYPDGYTCACGGTGCLETYASGSSIIARARESWLAGDLPEWEDTLPKSPYEVFQQALKGQEVCAHIFQGAGKALGIAMAGLLNSMNIAVFIIGGGVGDAFDLLLPSIRQEINARSFPLAAREVQILKAEMGNDAGMTGAALLR